MIRERFGRHHVGERVHAAGGLMHADAAQAVGKIAVSAEVRIASFA